MNFFHAISYAILLLSITALSSCGDSDFTSQTHGSADSGFNVQEFEFDRAANAKVPNYIAQLLDGIYFMDHWDFSQEVCTAHLSTEKNVLRLPRHCVRKQVEDKNFLFWRWKDEDDITSTELHLVLKDRSGKIVFSTEDGDSAYFISPKTYGELKHQDFSSDAALLKLSKELPQKMPAHFSIEPPVNESLVWISGFGNPKNTTARFAGDMIVGAGRKYSSSVEDLGQFAIRVQAVPWISGSPCVNNKGEVIGMAVGRTHPQNHVGCITNLQIQKTLAHK